MSLVNFISILGASNSTGYYALQWNDADYVMTLGDKIHVNSDGVYVGFAYNSNVLVQEVRPLLFKFDRDGNNLWRRQLNANTTPNNVSGAVEQLGSDSSGNVYIATEAYSSYFGLTKFQSDGTFLWNAGPNYPTQSSSLRSNQFIIGQNENRIYRFYKWYYQNFNRQVINASNGAILTTGADYPQKMGDQSGSDEYNQYFMSTAKSSTHGGILVVGKFMAYTTSPHRHYVDTMALDADGVFQNSNSQNNYIGNYQCGLREVVNYGTKFYVVGQTPNNVNDTGVGTLYNRLLRLNMATAGASTTLDQSIGCALSSSTNGEYRSLCMGPDGKIFVISYRNDFLLIHQYNGGSNHTGTITYEGAAQLTNIRVAASSYKQQVAEYDPESNSLFVVCNTTSNETQANRSKFILKLPADVSEIAALPSFTDSRGITYTFETPTNPTIENTQISWSTGYGTSAQDTGVGFYQDYGSANGLTGNNFTTELFGNKIGI